MRLTSLLVVSLSPASIFAKCVPRADDIKTDEQCTASLSYTGFGRATITFIDPGTNASLDYAIVTKYTTYYPDILANALVANGYDTTVLESDGLRGWTKYRSVYRTLGIDFHNHRGDIYWKQRDATYAPSLTSRAPSEDAFSDITKILMRNPPAGDVYMLCTIILAWTTSLLGYMLFMVLLMACIKKCDRNTNKSKGDEADEGIELDSLEVSNSHSLPDTITATTPFDDVKYNYTSPSPSRRLTTGTVHSDFLPTYSRQQSEYGVKFDNIRLD
ncbi:hypothetical protein ACET3X_008508 [Alternaria dauci]|uniref:Uncharacterized protein n=1 Tax=Alternaria dauci TaxID=48095 RepID=A0ABR3UAJ9_9PLEO